MPLIEIRNIRKRYGEHTVLDGLQLDVDEHQVVCLIGPSGCGKSTLLRCINGLEQIDGGEILIHGDRMTGVGVDVDALRRDIGIVFQSFKLFPHMTVLQNVTRRTIRRLLGHRPGRGGGQSAGAAQADRAGTQGECLSRPALRRSAATRRHCPRAGHGADRDAAR